MQGFIGVEAEQYWTNHPSEIPDGSKYKPEYLQAKVDKKEPTGDNDALKILVLWLLVYCSYSKADCLPNHEGFVTWSYSHRRNTSRSYRGFRNRDSNNYNYYYSHNTNCYKRRFR